MRKCFVRRLVLVVQIICREEVQRQLVRDFTTTVLVESNFSGKKSYQNILVLNREEVFSCTDSDNV